MRFGEALGLEIDKHLADDFTTILIRQQVKRGEITNKLKSEAAYRDIDVHPEFARLIREFVGDRKAGLLFPSERGTPQHQSNIRNRILYPILESIGSNKGGAHIFRRFRVTWLRKQRAPEDLIRMWLGHGDTTVTDLYVNVEEDKAWRKEQAEKIGVGFTLPTSVVPNVPNSQEV